MARSTKKLQARLTIAFGVILCLVALSLLAVPWVMQLKAAYDSARQAQAVEDIVAAWPEEKSRKALKAAEEYNAKLAQQGQPTLGESYDPFTDTPVNAGEDVRSDQDEEYMGLLNAGEGLMGSVVIPKISVDMPILHGTSKISLSRGAGHLYGTSLPVGAGGAAGGSAHTVLTGHRGLAQAEMFTRLDELRIGDYMYEKVFGRTLAYRIDRITVIEPTDTSKLRIEKGEDRLTLMTCTPFGVNTQRLLVSGVRVPMPPAPNPDQSDKDLTKIWQWAFILMALTALLGLLVYRFAPPFKAARQEAALHIKHRAPDASSPPHSRR